MTNSSSGIYFVAFYFPPVDRGSGVYRAVCNARAFVDDGWDVSVLTAKEYVLPGIREEARKEIAPGMDVQRAFGLDAQKHLSIGGRYLGIFAMPDRWSAWIVGGFVRGLWHVMTKRPRFIVSTSPIASAHVIAWLLNRAAHVRWVAELRDPLLQEAYPEGRMLRRTLRFVERLIARYAEFVIFTTTSTQQFYVERYGAGLLAKSHVIENGFDEEAVLRAEAECDSKPRENECFTILHSGSLYPVGRNIEPLLRGLAKSIAAGQLVRGTVLIRFRGSSNEANLQQLAESLGLGSSVEILPSTDAHSAIVEMLSADVLMLIQGSRFNRQIPAKLYEYSRCGKPIMALVDATGETCSALRELGVERVVDPEDEDRIAEFLNKLVNDEEFRGSLIVEKELVASMSRQARGAAFSSLLKRAILP